MAEVRDVAEHILSRLGEISTLKLQKLVYYAQAWHLVWENRPLFASRIEAWANGPMCPDLYELHRGKYDISTVRGRSDRLSEDEAESVDAVVKFYKKYDGQQLSDLTHDEAPWQQARKGLEPLERGDKEITRASMKKYYASL